MLPVCKSRSILVQFELPSGKDGKSFYEAVIIVLKCAAVHLYDVFPIFANLVREIYHSCPAPVSDRFSETKVLNIIESVL